MFAGWRLRNEIASLEDLGEGLLAQLKAVHPELLQPLWMDQLTVQILQVYLLVSSQRLFGGRLTKDGISAASWKAFERLVAKHSPVPISKIEALLNSTTAEQYRKSAFAKGDKVALIGLGLTRDGFMDDPLYRRAFEIASVTSLNDPTIDKYGHASRCLFRYYVKERFDLLP